VPTFYEFSAPQCSAEEFDGEVVAINLDTGIYFSLKAPASWIFTDLSAGHSVETLLNIVAADSNLYLAVDVFISELVSSGLLRAKVSVSEPIVDPLLGSIPIHDLTPPILESFGDMQSLLLLDPVHDVDENLGWPVLPVSKPSM
jgi:hypothetical protein